MQLSNTTRNKERSILVLFLLNLNQANGKRLVINRGNPSENIICLKRNHIFATYAVYSVSSKQLGRSCRCLDRVNVSTKCGKAGTMPWKLEKIQALPPHNVLVGKIRPATEA